MEKITDTVRINSLLQKLKEQRTLLAVKLQNQDALFNSAVIDFNPTEGFLVLDELKPETGDELLRKSPNVQIRTQIDGVSLHFAGAVIEFGVQDNIPFYKLATPNELGYLQRRQTVRIRLGAAHPVVARLESEDGIRHEGEIDDMSLGGLRIRFKRALPTTIQAGQKMSCSFLLPPENKERFNCQIIVRVVRHSSDPLINAFVGGQFTDLQPASERRLQKLIMTLQRLTQQKRNL